MMMKVFPHGTGQGDKPTRYLVRMDYPGRDTAPPHILRGNIALTRALIDSIDRRWKFTAGVLSWHTDDKVSEEKEWEVMDAFEEVAFAGLEPDQRNILWVRHTHAGHHELHFVIPRMELSSGNDFNACPPGWQKDFDVFRDLFNWKENWARPDDPARTREEIPKKADLFKARMVRWGKAIHESERDRIKDEIHARLKRLISEGLIVDRTAVIEAMKDMDLSINRAGKDYVSVKMPESGMKLRFRGGIYAEAWKAAQKAEIEDEQEEREKARKRVTMLANDLQKVIDKRAACNRKRYPLRWIKIEKGEELALPVKEMINEPDFHGKAVATGNEKSGAGIRNQGSCDVPAVDGHGGGTEGGKMGIAEIERYVRGCEKLVCELAGPVKQDQGERVKPPEPEAPRRFRMR